MKKRDLIERLKNLPLVEPRSELDQRILAVTRQSGIDHLPVDAKKFRVSFSPVPVCLGLATVAIVCVFTIFYQTSENKHVRQCIVLNKSEAGFLSEMAPHNNVFQRSNQSIVSIMGKNNVRTTHDNGGSL